MAGLGADGALAGVDVLVEDFPEVIGHAQEFEVLGVSTIKKIIRFEVVVFIILKNDYKFKYVKFKHIHKL